MQRPGGGIKFGMFVRNLGPRGKCEVDRQRKDHTVVES